METTTDQRAGLTDVDAVLSSFRPGGFELRQADELIPMRHGVIGQETQGPGGMMMSFRSIQVIQSILDDLDAVVAPEAVIFNYTNPVNIVSQAVTMHSDRLIYSMCEGPMTFWQPILTHGRARSRPGRGDDGRRQPQLLVDGAHLRRSGPDAAAGRGLREDRRRPDACRVWDKRMLHLAVAMGSIPSDYFRYYYFGDEYFREAQAQRLTRAGVLLDALPGYWDALRGAGATPTCPSWIRTRSRGGIHELELAIDVMSAYYNDTPARLPVNLPNTGGALPGFDEDTVVEMWCDVDGTGARPVPAAAAAARGPRDHPDAGGVPAARRRGGLGWHPRRRRTGARPPTRSSATCTSPRSSTTTWRTRTATTCRSVCCDDRATRAAGARGRRRQLQDGGRRGRR